MAWIYLVLAGGLEIVWAYFMKKSEGFSSDADNHHHRNDDRQLCTAVNCHA